MGMTVEQTIRYYMNYSDYQRREQEENALISNGFSLEMVPAEGFTDGSTWPRWVRDGKEYTCRDALATEARIQRVFKYHRIIEK